MADDASAGPGEAGELRPNRILDTADRRVAANVYLVAAVVAAGLVLATDVDLMWLTAVLPLVGIAAYHVVTGKRMRVRDMEAISIASDHAPFDVGHASATLGFVGIRARPVWEVLTYESGDAPSHQALITVDALTGQVTGSFSEPVQAP
jgi:hypothetical protein